MQTNPDIADHITLVILLGSIFMVIIVTAGVIDFVKKYNKKLKQRDGQ